MRPRLVLAPALVLAAGLAYPAPRARVGDPSKTAGLGSARTFANPIIPGFHPDPSIVRVGADFYLVTSSFEYFPGVPIFHSRDLVHWRQLGHVLTDRRQLVLQGVPSSGGIYAATIRHGAGRFHVITTLMSGGGGGPAGNFYVTATDPRGPWSDPIWLDKEGFDPSLLFADDKAYYLRDGKGPDFSHPQVYQTTIDLETGKIREPARVIWSGTGGVWPEGAHLYKLRGRYYLLAAEGGTEYGHSEVVARSASPFGPFEPFAGNPILTHRTRADHPIQATGHVDLVELDDGTTWAVFLGTRPQPGRHTHLGRETFLAPVRWTEDGWPVVGEADGKAGTVELQMKAPGLAPHPFPAEPARDDFDRAALGPTWSFVRNPDPRDSSLSERRGFLRLLGSPATLDDVASPALVVRRQQHFKLQCRAALDFSPREANEEAGLTVRANEAFRYDLAIQRGPAGREALLRRRVAGASTIVERARLDDGAIQLALVADETSYRFEIKSGGKTRILGSLPTSDLSAEAIFKQGRNHFTGAVIGLYATGNGRRSTVPADFDWFDYVPTPDRAER